MKEIKHKQMERQPVLMNWKTILLKCALPKVIYQNSNGIFLKINNSLIYIES